MKRDTKFKRFRFRLLATCLAIISLAATASVVTYKIKKGDTLSGILYAHGIKTLYGKNGFVTLTTKLNKNIKKKDLILAGQIIQLPIKIEVNQEIERKVATVEPVIATGDYPYSHFVSSPHLSFLRIDSSNDINFGGSSITALSKSGFGVDLAWHVFYDERFSFYGFGSLDYFSFYKHPEYSLNNSNVTRLHFGVGGSFNYLPDLQFNSKLSLREVSFLDVITPTTINSESLSIPEVEVGFAKTIFTKKKLSGVLGAHVLGLLPGSRGNYKSKMGYGIGSSFEVIHTKKALFLNYDLRSLEINEIKNKESSIVLGMNFFGDDAF